MSNSDYEDPVFDDAYSIGNGEMNIFAKGPNNTTINLVSRPNNISTSTLQRSGYLKLQRHGNSNYDQRSLCIRREISPTSVRSYQSLPRNFQNTKRRCMSSVSTRSIKTNASYTAKEIAKAIKNNGFTYSDMEVIKRAILKYLRCQSREKEKELRQWNRLLLNSQDNDNDSGEQGSDSSTSSDESRSRTTGVSKENLPSDISMRSYPNHLRATRSINTTMHQNITNFPPSALKNKFALNMVSQKTEVQNIMTIAEPKTTLQKDQFDNPLPSQRFNKFDRNTSFLKNFEQNSKNSTIVNSTERQMENQITKPQGTTLAGLDSEEETIFPATALIRNNSNRVLNENNISYFGRNRSKIEKTTMSNTCRETQTNTSSNGDNSVFVKPQLPKMKPCKSKSKGVSPEKVTNKTSKLLTTAIHNLNSELPASQTVTNNETRLFEDNGNIAKLASVNANLELTSASNGDVTKRQSSLKRKLFTPTIAMTENNAGSDTSLTNSPCSKKYCGVNLKNKARKLTSQSCLSHDIVGENNDLHDLISKIVPRDSTTVTDTNKKVDTLKKNIQVESKEDKTKDVSTFDNDESVSDTYTDEEIFNIPKNTNGKKPIAKAQTKTIAQKTLTDKKTSKVKNKQTRDLTKPEVEQKRTESCIKTFWDIDSESDMEFDRSMLHRTALGAGSVFNTTHRPVTRAISGISEKTHDSTISEKSTSPAAKVKNQNNKKKVVPSESKQTISDLNISTRNLRPRSNTSHNFEENFKCCQVMLLRHKWPSSRGPTKTKIINQSPDSKKPQTKLNISRESLRPRVRNNSCNNSVLEKTINKGGKRSNNKSVNV